MIQQPHSWTYVQIKLSFKKIHAPLCSLLHYLQLPPHGNNPNVHQQMNGLRRYGAYTQWNATWPSKKNKIMPFAATCMELESLILSKSERERQISYHTTYIWNLIYGTNEQNRNNHGQRTDLCLPMGRGREWDGLGVLGLVDEKYGIWGRKAMRSCCIAQGIISNHLLWKMMEDNVKKEYIYMLNWVTLLYIRN